MAERAMVEAEVTFRPHSEGGRSVPPGALSDRLYRPHIVIGDPGLNQGALTPERLATEEYLGVAFTSGPAPVPVGERILVQMMLIYWPSIDYAQALPGATFTLREGKRIVGQGRITRRWIAPWEAAS